MSELQSVQGAVEIVVRRVVEQLGDENLNASRLIKSLAKLTVEDVSEPDIGWENAKYHATRLALELDNAKNIPDKDRCYINRIWKDMVEAYEIILPSIENDARKTGHGKILRPRKTDPKTGRVEFYLEFVELDELQHSGRSQSTDEAVHKGKVVIQYDYIKNPKPTLLGRLFSKVVLYSPIEWAYHLLPFVLFFVALSWYFYMSNMEAYQSATAFVLFVFYSGVLAYLFRSFYLVSHRGIAMAPIWMAGYMSQEGAQIQIRDSGKASSSGKVIPEIALVVYEGVCPVCDSKVAIGRGKKQFRGRLIGKCYRNPIEHIYSFDYVTGKGVPLRNDTYLG